MNESKEILRQRFEAETDIVIELYPADWKRYAEWLEDLSIKKLNNELLQANERIRNKMREAIKTLEEGIAGS